MSDARPLSHRPAAAAAGVGRLLIGLLLLLGAGLLSAEPRSWHSGAGVAGNDEPSTARAAAISTRPSRISSSRGGSRARTAPRR